MKIVLTDNMKVCPDNFHINEIKFVKVTPCKILSFPSREEVFAIVGGRSLIGKCALEISKTFPNCKFVQLLSTGYDDIDLSGFKEQSIIVSNASGIYDETVAEYVVFMMLKYAKRYHKSLKNTFNRPLRNYHYITELKGKTVGIMGVGRIGSRIAKILTGFDMNVIGYAQNTQKKDYFSEIHHLNTIREFFLTSDFVINVLPHTKSTNGFLTSEYFSFMKDNVVFINVGRESIYSKDALIDFFGNHKEAVAVLDIFELLPNPLSKLRCLKNIYITPRVAACSQESDKELTALISSNLLSVFEGKQPRNILY